MLLLENRFVSMICRVRNYFGIEDWCIVCWPVWGCRRLIGRRLIEMVDLELKNRYDKSISRRFDPSPGFEVVAEMKVTSGFE